jgi:transposase
MDTSQQVVVSREKEASAAGRRQRRSIAEKRRIVEETLTPGASVARVARAHGINANQVFGWRRLYLAGRLGELKREIKLLSVRVSDSKSAAVVEHGAADVAQQPSGSIHIELRQAQVRIEGSVDPALVRVLLECWCRPSWNRIRSLGTCSCFAGGAAISSRCSGLMEMVCVY